MPMVQQTQKENASLPIWLSRDVPHERELARELLEQMGREKSLDYLLHLHDLEETRRQKWVRRYVAGIVSASCVALLVAGALLYSVFCIPSGASLLWLRVCVPLIWICSLCLHSLNFWAWRARGKKTPWFSSPVQQKVVTSLLDYADTPLVADALCRATVYYTGDRSRLYERLIQTLCLLPDDADALTPYARRVLTARLSTMTTASYKGEKERLPALQAAIKRYFARTGKPTWHTKGGFFKTRRG